ncbi:MAG: hypothetical protein CMA70_03395 [Euryarchaeota archaeon]|nr:hypothetical protein [Euryarchaeota archaeon]
MLLNRLEVVGAAADALVDVAREQPPEVSEECWDQVDEDWDAMTEEERKELLDRELDEYYGRDTSARDIGKGMLLWAYLMGRSQGLKEKSE